MKTKLFLLTLISLLSVSCKNRVDAQDTASIPISSNDTLTYSDSVKGNFKGNDKIVYAWSVGKADKWAIEEKDPNKCYNYIEFSDSSIPRILTNYWLLNTLVNEGDLNQDGKDEIGTIIYANPDMGNWHEYHVWTLQQDKWVHLIEPFAVFVGADLNLSNLVQLDSTNTLELLIRYNEFEDEEGVITKSKKVSLKNHTDS